MYINKNKLLTSFCKNVILQQVFLYGKKKSRGLIDVKFRNDEKFINLKGGNTK